MTAATIGNWKVKIGTTASPQVLTEIEEVLDLDGFGEQAGVVDVTNFDSTVGSKEFIAEPAEGTEFTVTFNFVPGTTHQQALRASKGTTLLFDIRYLGTSPNQKWTGSVVNLGWGINPDLSAQNQAQLTFKITGAVTEAGG